MMDMFDRLLRERLVTEWTQNQRHNDLETVIHEICSRKISPNQALNMLLSA